jgi:hypothetical protein
MLPLLSLWASNSCPLTIDALRLSFPSNSATISLPLNINLFKLPFSLTSNLNPSGSYLFFIKPPSALCTLAVWLKQSNVYFLFHVFRFQQLGFLEDHTCRKFEYHLLFFPSACFFYHSCGLILHYSLHFLQLCQLSFCHHHNCILHYYKKREI